MIKSNFKKFSKHYKDTKKQVAFATSKAINDTLKDARKATINQASRAQKSGKAWWNNKEYGIRRTFANKRKLIGTLFTKIYWGKLQEKGGIKKPRGKNIVVPTENMAKGNRKAGGARKVLKQKTVFINKAKQAIYRRVGGKKSRKVKRLATLTKTAHIDRPILNFTRTAHKTTKRRFRRHLRNAMRFAMKTRR